MLEVVDGNPFQKGILDPTIDADSKHWWDALGEGHLLIPRCLECWQFWFPPSPACPACGADRFEWVEASGRGTIYSWVVVRRALHPAFTEDLPYTVVAVDLDEGARVLGRLIEGQPGPAVHVQALVYLVEKRPLLGFRSTI